jgi:hypothetical protein
MTVPFRTTSLIDLRYLGSKIQYPCNQNSVGLPAGGELCGLLSLVLDTSRCELRMTFFSHRPRWIEKTVHRAWVFPTRIVSMKCVQLNNHSLTLVEIASSANDNGSRRFVHIDLSIPYVTQNKSERSCFCSESNPSGLSLYSPKPRTILTALAIHVQLSTLSGHM